jgi:hypothetical protein
MTRAATFAEDSLAHALAREGAKPARKQAQARPPFAGWCEPGEILGLRPELSAAIAVLKLRHVNAAAARVRIGAVMVNGILITQLPSDSGVARAHLTAIESEDDFAIAEIADPQVKAAPDRDLQIAAHLLESEEVVP